MNKNKSFCLDIKLEHLINYLFYNITFIIFYSFKYFQLKKFP